MTAQLDVCEDLAEVIAETTIKIFQLNDPDRVIIRQELVMDGRWP